MITSKIIKHLKRQDWGAALIDFIVVVLGIFVAIQVNSWNEERVDKLKERRILEQLYSDFSQNVENINSMATFHKNKAKDLDYVIDMVATDKIDLDSKRAREALMSMFQMPPISVSMGTYKSLIATGDIRLIQDPQLKTQLIELDAMLENEISMLNYFRQLNITELEYVRGLVSVQANDDKSGTFIDVDLQRFKHDKHLLTTVANQERNHLVFSRIRSEIAQEFARVKTYIGEILEKA